MEPVARFLFFIIIVGCSDGNLFPFRSVENFGEEDVSSDSISSPETDLQNGSSTDPGNNNDAGIDADTETDSINPPNDSESTTVAGLIWIPIIGGTFEMGSTLVSDEQPVHEVSVRPFEMLKTEVTVAQYESCVNAAVCTVPGNDSPEDNWGVVGREKHPINRVTWDQAVSFCAWLGARLPSEAEWEYVASNGSAGNTYPWGEAEATCKVAVFDEIGGADGCGTGLTMEVCSKTTGNAIHGLCDMAGNLAEWVQDWYHPTYTNAPNNGTAWEDADGASGRVIRGGGLFSDREQLRATSRDRSGPLGQSNNTGFRCAR